MKKQRPNRIKWYKSIRNSILLGLLAMMILVAFVAYYIVSVRGKAQVIAETDKIVEQVGNSIVSQINACLSKVSEVAINQALTITSVQKNEETFVRVIPNTLDTRRNTSVIGGGVWTAPYQFSPSLLKQSFYWHENVAGMLEYINNYNETENYFDKDWFITGWVSKPNQCIWSETTSTFIEHFSHTPSLTCSVRIDMDSSFFGTSTVDLNLNELSEKIAKWQQRTDGYVFVTDITNRIISFPNEPLAQAPVIDRHGHTLHRFVSMKELVKHKTEFLPVLASLDQFNRQTLEIAKNKDGKVFEEIYTTLIEKSNTLTKETAELKTVSILDSLSDHFSKKHSTLFAEVDITQDSYFGEDARAYLFHIPETYWKLGIVKPTSQADNFANRLSNDILRYLLMAFFFILLLSFFLLNRTFVRPLEQMASSLRIIGELINQKRSLELNNHRIKFKHENEVGRVAQSINQLIDRVAHNESAITASNIMLEHMVENRTEELTDTLKALQKSQTELVTSEKMALLGQMVAGVAHEVNTPLGYVKNNVLMTRDMVASYNELIHEGALLGELLNSDEFSDERLQETLDEIVEIAQNLKDENVSEDMLQMFDDTLFGVEQISELVVNLKNFARLDESKVKNIDVHECIETSLNISRNNLKHIEIKKLYMNLPKISCSPSQLNQVLLNLFNNAAQAIHHDDGIIVVSTSFDDDYVYISIMDNGTGMSRETIKRIFQPFFTTKPAGEGTGLGLAISMQIIEQHKGKIKVASKVGEGTKFVISLPITPVLMKDSDSKD